MVTSAEDPHDCNSYWAQGGIIYKATDDSPSLLSQDILIAGAGVVDRRIHESGAPCVMSVKRSSITLGSWADGGAWACGMLLAGANVNDKKAVRKLAEDGPGCVEDLLIHTAKVRHEAAR